MYTFDHTPMPEKLFNPVESRRRAWEKGISTYGWDFYAEDAGDFYPNVDCQSPPIENKSRVVECQFCKTDAQQTKVGQNWLCHSCQTLADLARDTYRELAKGCVIWGTYLYELRRNGRI